MAYKETTDIFGTTYGSAIKESKPTPQEMYPDIGLSDNAHWSNDTGVKRKPTSNYNNYTPYGDTTTKSETDRSNTSPIKFSRSTSAPTQYIQTGSNTSSTSTRVAPSGPAPQIGDLGEFDKPEWDEREVARLTQVKAAPGVRKLRSAVQRATSTPYENPNVKAMTLRQALEGYGLGLQGVMTGAESAAQSEYGQRYSQEYQAEALNYQTSVQQKMTQFQADFQNYLNQYTTQTTQTSTPTYTTGDRLQAQLDEEEASPTYNRWGSSIG